MRKYRHLFSILNFLALIFLPFWIYLPLLFISIALLPFYWEGIFLSLLIDTLYGEIGFSPDVMLRMFSFWALVMLVCLLPLRRIIRHYA